FFAMSRWGLLFLSGAEVGPSSPERECCCAPLTNFGGGVYYLFASDSITNYINYHRQRNLPMSFPAIETNLPGGEALRLRTVNPADEVFLLSVYASSRADELAQVQWAEGQKEAFVKWQFDLQRREY